MHAFKNKVVNCLTAIGMQPYDTVKLGYPVGVFPKLFIQVRLDAVRHISHQEKPLIHIGMSCTTVFTSRRFDGSTRLNTSVNAYVNWETTEADITRTCINLFENLKNIKDYANYRR